MRWDYFRAVFGEVVAILFKIGLVLVVVWFALWFFTKSVDVGKAGRENRREWFGVD